MTRKKIERDLEKAKLRVGKFVSRDGYQYGAHGYQFDAEIENRRNFAIDWRHHALMLMDEHKAQYRRVSKRMWGATMYQEIYERIFHVFSINGKDVWMTCPSLPSTSQYREVDLKESPSAEAYLKEKIGRCRY